MTWDLSRPTLPPRNPCRYCGRHIEQFSDFTGSVWVSYGATVRCTDSPDHLHAPREAS